MASNKQIGQVVLGISVSIFIYYTFWVTVLPFMLVDADNWIHSLFPPLRYAFMIPAILGIIFFGGLSVYTLFHLRGLISIF